MRGDAVHHKRRETHPVGLGSRRRNTLSRLLGASNWLDDALASPAGALLPRNRDMGSYEYPMLDFIHQLKTMPPFLSALVAC